MTILKSGQLKNIVRDYVYDMTVSGKAVTVEETLEGVNRIRGVKSSAGAIRKVLRQLRDEDLLNYDDFSRTPPAYSWNNRKPTPEDYTHRTFPNLIPVNLPMVPSTLLPKGQPMTTPTSMPAGDDAKREILKGKLQARMNEITGEKTAKQQEEEIPVPKKNAKPGVTRRNGQVYLTREIAGMADVDYLRKLREEGMFPMLEGPPGTGKTVVVDAAFGEHPSGLYTVSADDNTGVEDFMGQWSPTGNSANPYVWVDGPLILAMKSGGVLFVDDATLAPPKVLASMYPAMDGRGEVTVKGHIVGGKLEVVKAQPGFFVVAAHNPGVHGAILTDALASRFIVRIKVETDLELAASLGVDPNFIKLVKVLQAEREGGHSNLYIPQLRELIAAMRMSKKFGLDVAAANLLAVTPEDDQDFMHDKMRIVFNKDFVPLEIGKQL